MLAYTRGMSTTTTPTDRPTRPAPSASSPNPTEGENASALPCGGPGCLQAGGQAAPHAYGVHTRGPRQLPPLPIYLGAQNTPAPTPAPAPAPTPTPTPEAAPEAERGLPGPAASTAPAHHDAPSSAYNPAALLRQLLLLLALLLGLALWLGGWQPATSSARLGWSHGTIDVVEGTDGDTGSRPLPPHDAGVLPAPDLPPMSSSLSPKMSSSLDTPPHPVDLPRAFFEGSGPGGASVNPPPSGSQA